MLESHPMLVVLVLYCAVHGSDWTDNGAAWLDELSKIDLEDIVATQTRGRSATLICGMYELVER